MTSIILRILDLFLFLHNDPMRKVLLLPHFIAEEGKEQRVETISPGYIMKKRRVKNLGLSDYKALLTTSPWCLKVQLLLKGNPAKLCEGLKG